MLDDDSAVPMHDPFGESCRARGVQDPERMIERHRVVFEWTRLGCQFGPAGCTIQLRGSVQVGHQRSPGQARHLLTQCPYRLPYVERPTPVAIAVDCEEYGWFQLGEPIAHGTCPEVR